MKKSQIFACLIFSIFIWTSPAIAEEHKEETDVLRLEPITVIGEREKKGGVRVPSVVETVTPEVLRSINYTGTEDILRNLPNLYVRKIYPGSTNMPLVIRGNATYQTTRSLVLVDDIMLTNPLGAGHGYAPRWQMVSPEEIERIDVIYGPFSALYSGNTIGGAAIIKTRLPEKREFHFSSSYIYHPFREFRTNDDLHGFTAHFSYGDKFFNKLRFFFLYDRYDNEVQPISFLTLKKESGKAPVGNPVTGWESDISCDNDLVYVVGTRSSKADIKNNLFKVKLGFDIDDFTQLEFDWVYWDHEQDYNDPETYLRDANGNPVYSGTVDIMGKSYKISSSKFYYREREEKNYLYALHFRRQKKDGLSIRATASYYDINKDLSKKSGSAPPLSKDGGKGSIQDNDSGWCTFDLRLSYPYKSPLNIHNLTIGYHYDRVFTDTESWNASDWKKDIRTSLSLQSEGKTETHAFFFEDIWDITPKWSLYLGGRYERWRGFDANKERDTANGRVRIHLKKRDEDHFSPKFAINFRPNKEWNMRLSLAKSYRFPTVGEMYQGGISATGFLIKTNPNLKPEEVYSIDATITKMFGNSGKARLSWWFNWEKDSIFRQVNIYTMVKNFQNIDRVRKWGVEFEVDKKDFIIPRLNGMLSVSYTDAEIRKNSNLPSSEGKDFPRVPHWLIKSMLIYSPIETLTLSISERYASKQYNTLTNTDRRRGYGCVEDYLIFDFKAVYQIKKHLNLSFCVDNITDTLYHVSHPYPRRTFYFSLSYNH